METNTVASKTKTQPERIFTLRIVQRRTSVSVRQRQEAQEVLRRVKHDRAMQGEVWNIATNGE